MALISVGEGEEISGRLCATCQLNMESCLEISSAKGLGTKAFLSCAATSIELLTFRFFGALPNIWLPMIRDPACRGQTFDMSLYEAKESTESVEVKELGRAECLAKHLSSSPTCAACFLTTDASVEGVKKQLAQCLERSQLAEARSERRLLNAFLKPKIQAAVLCSSSVDREDQERLIAD